VAARIGESVSATIKAVGSALGNFMSKNPTYVVNMARLQVCRQASLRWYSSSQTCSGTCLPRSVAGSSGVPSGASSACISHRSCSIPSRCVRRACRSVWVLASLSMVGIWAELKSGIFLPVARAL
jgi:hypothetical protein